MSHIYLTPRTSNSGMLRPKKSLIELSAKPMHKIENEITSNIPKQHMVLKKSISFQEPNSHIYSPHHIQNHEEVPELKHYQSYQSHSKFDTSHPELKENNSNTFEKRLN